MAKRVFLMIAVSKPFKESVMRMFREKDQSMSDNVRDHLVDLLVDHEGVPKTKVAEDDDVTVIQQAPEVPQLTDQVAKAPGGGARPGPAMAEAAMNRVEEVPEDDDDAYWGE